MKGDSGANISEDRKLSSEIFEVLRTGPAIVLELVWLYVVGWGVYLASSALQSDGGDLGLEGWLIIGTLVTPLIKKEGVNFAFFFDFRAETAEAKSTNHQVRTSQTR